METTSDDINHLVENTCIQNEESRTPTPSNETELELFSPKITIRLHAVANTPILRKKTFFVPPSRKVAEVLSSIRKLTKLNSADGLFVYVNQAFAPGLDQTIENLFECFGVEGVLNMYYCITPAWG